MGVINLTPDSFSDGGRYDSLSRALLQTEKLVHEGAQIIDLGGESTRPGSQTVSPEEEWKRLEPLLKEIQTQRLLPPEVYLSVDTYKEQVMLKSLDLGVDMINNVKGLASAATLKALGKNKIQYISMFGHPNPQIMQNAPLDSHQALKKCWSHCQTSTETLMDCGFSQENIYLDPGIGFGKTDAANLSLLGQTQELSNKYNLAIGISRKSFIGRLTNLIAPVDRDPPSKMLEMSLAFMGAKIIRTHQVKPLRIIQKTLEEGA